MATHNKGGLRSIEDKVKHCADCAFHVCKNKCTTSFYSCDGYCKMRGRHRQCESAICKFFKLDGLDR